MSYLVATLFAGAFLAAVIGSPLSVTHSSLEPDDYPEPIDISHLIDISE